MLAALLIASLPAQAVDLELTIGVPFREPVEMTLHDIDEGSVPGVVLPGVDGERYVVSIDVAETEDAYRVSFLIEGMEPTRTGRARTWLVSHPTLVVPPDELARLYQGPRYQPGEAGAIDRVLIEAVVRTFDE